MGGSAAISKFLSVRSRGVAFFINELDKEVTDRFVHRAGGIVTNVPAMDIIQKLISVPSGTETFVFLDPPYLKFVRPGSLDLYKYDMTYEDHYRLLLAVLDLKCNCMIIHPQCKLYDLVLKSFRQVQVTVRYHNKTSHEIMYMNYAVPDRLLNYSVVGIDCWDRQRIKRKGDRLVKKITELPVLEQNYLIDRILSIN